MKKKVRPKNESFFLPFNSFLQYLTIRWRGSRLEILRWRFVCFFAAAAADDEAVKNAFLQQNKKGWTFHV